MSWVNANGIIVAALLSLLFASPVCIAARLRINRVSGTQVGNSIKGRFSARIRDAGEVESVDFYLDGELVLTDAEDPFRWSFTTGDYPDGNHTIGARIHFTDGSVEKLEDSREFVKDFGQWWNLFITGMFVFVAGMITFSIWITNRERKKPQGRTKCPRCGTVFDRKWSPVHKGSAYRNECPTCMRKFWADEIDE